MIKMKPLLKESTWTNRKFGESLPTLEDYMKEAEDDAYVHVGGGTYKEKNRGTGEPLPNSPSYIKKDGGGFEMVDDDDPRLSKGDDDQTGGDPDDSWDDEEGRAKPKGKTDADTDDDEPAGKLGGGDYERETEPERGDKPSGEKSPEDMSDDELETADNDLRQKSNHLMSRAMGGDDTRSTAYSGGTPSDKEWAELGKQSKAVKKEKQKRAAGGEPEDKPFGGDTGTDADFGIDPDDIDDLSPDAVLGVDDEPDDSFGEPDFYDPEDYEKLYPDKTKPKDEVGDIKYGKGFSPDSDHMFDSVAGSASSASDKYSELLDSVKSGNWKQFRSRIHDIYDDDAREHLLNLANHVDSGTYNDEFPKGKKGLKFGRKEVMDLFRQAADYGDEQFPVDPDDIDDLPGGSEPEDKEESITINGKQYTRISESIVPVEPTVFDPNVEIKDFWNRMKDK